MEYLVQVVTLTEEKQEKDFQNYREASYGATNYARLKFSEGIRQGEDIYEFKI